MLAQLSEGIPGDKETGKREATQDKKKTRYTIKRWHDYSEIFNQINCSMIISKLYDKHP